MKLYDVPCNTRIRVTDPEEAPIGGIPIEEKEYNFYHIDGMYSYCTDDDGNVVHIKAWTEVETVPERQGEDV